MSTPLESKNLERLGRRWLTLSSLAAAVGILLCVFGQPEVGGVVTVAGLGALAMGLHKLGRSGADPPC